MASSRIARVCGLVCTSLFMAAGAGGQPPLPNMDSAPGLVRWLNPPMHFTLQPLDAPRGPPSLIVDIEPGRQTYGPLDLPFPVTLGGVVHERFFVSTQGFLSFDEPLPDQFGTSNLLLWPSLTTTTLALGSDANRVVYPRRIELRVEGRPGRRVFTVSLVDLPLVSPAGAVHSAHARFEEATGDLALSDAGPRRGDPWAWTDQNSFLGLAVLDIPEPFGGDYWCDPGGARSVTLVISDCDPTTHRDRDADTLVDA